MTPSLPPVSSSARRPKPAVPPKQGSEKSAASAVHVAKGAPSLGVNVGGVKNTATEQSTSAASERGRASIFTGDRTGTGAKPMQNRLQDFQSKRLFEGAQAGPSPSSNVSPLASSPQDGNYESLLLPALGAQDDIYESFPLPALGAKDDIYEFCPLPALGVKGDIYEYFPLPAQRAQASGFSPSAHSSGPYQASNDIEEYCFLGQLASERVEDPVYEYLTIPIVGASEKPLCDFPIEFPAKKTKSKFKIFSKNKKGKQAVVATSQQRVETGLLCDYSESKPGETTSHYQAKGASAAALAGKSSPALKSIQDINVSGGQAPLKWIQGNQSVNDLVIRSLHNGYHVSSATLFAEQDAVITRKPGDRWKINIEGCTVQESRNPFHEGIPSTYLYVSTPSSHSFIFCKSTRSIVAITYL